jgi:DNA-binding CsgD family transcriptional regulator
MLDDLESICLDGLAPATMAALRAPSSGDAQVFYAGPERRGRAAPMTRWLSLMLDEIDYGMLLLADADQVVHINHVARSELDADHPLQLLGGGLRARRPQDVAALRGAIDGAATKGRRCLIKLDADGAQCVVVAVIPLPAPGGEPATLMVFGKRRVCQDLSVHWFARHHGLTPAETRVLKALCGGSQPVDIAAELGVAICTVRSHINSARLKTGAAGIRALVRQVAVLPPMVSALREPMH